MFYCSNIISSYHKLWNIFWKYIFKKSFSFFNFAGLINNIYNKQCYDEMTIKTYYRVRNARKIHAKCHFNSSTLVYIWTTIAHLYLYVYVYVWHPIPSSSHSAILPIFPSLRHYLHETRKRPIRLTYVAARLLLQRSLQSRFWHSYSRARIFMIIPVKYTVGHRGRQNGSRRDRQSLGHGRGS